MSTAYIETSVPSYYVARPSTNLLQAARQAVTRSWWDGGCSGLDLYTSTETTEEAGRGDREMAEARRQLLKDIPRLAINRRVGLLAAKLIARGLIPAVAGSDAIHISVASVHGLDFLVTWNFRHIANPFIRSRLGEEVEAFGVRLPVICTPEELVEDHGDH
jgi:hypothetical protein